MNLQVEIKNFVLHAVLILTEKGAANMHVYADSKLLMNAYNIKEIGKKIIAKKLANTADVGEKIIPKKFNESINLNTKDAAHCEFANSKRLGSALNFKPPPLNIKPNNSNTSNFIKIQRIEMISCILRLCCQGLSKE